MLKNVLALVVLGVLTAGCASTQPASLNGLSQVFHDPGFAVQGKTRRDQIWVSQTQETGIRVLGWKRPQHVTTPAHKTTIHKAPVIHKTKPTVTQEPVEKVSPTPVETTAPQQNPSRVQRLKDEIKVLNQKVRTLEGK